MVTAITDQSVASKVYTSTKGFYIRMVGGLNRRTSVEMAYSIFDPIPTRRSGKRKCIMASSRVPGLNANSKWYWPCRTSNTEDLLVLQTFYWSYKSFFYIKRKKKHCSQLTDNIYFCLFSLHLFQIYLGYS